MDAAVLAAIEGKQPEPEQVMPIGWPPPHGQLSTATCHTHSAP